MAGSDIDRLPALPLDQLDSQQRAAAQAIIDGPRGALYGPFVPLIRSPELMETAQRMGEYLRYRSAIGTRLSELAILVTARQWDQQVEWAIHAPLAVQNGIAQAAVDAIAARLAREHPDTNAGWGVRLVPAHGVVDLMGINGYYTFLAMVMNGAQTAVPALGVPPMPA